MFIIVRFNFYRLYYVDVVLYRFFYESFFGGLTSIGLVKFLTN
jgi:hypothetical protein